MRNFFFSHSVFKRVVLQTRKNQALFSKELTHKPLFLPSLEKRLFVNKVGKWGGGAAGFPDNQFQTCKLDKMSRDQFTFYDTITNVNDPVYVAFCTHCVKRKICIFSFPTMFPNFPTQISFMLSFANAFIRDQFESLLYDKI